MLKIRKNAHRQGNLGRTVAGMPLAVIAKIVSVIVILAALIVSGVGAYQWYTAKGGEPPMSTTYSTNPNAATHEPPKQVSEAIEEKKIPLSFTRFTSVGEAGKEMVVIVKTAPGATCKIKFEYGENKVIAATPSSIVRKADRDGAAAWRWTLEAGVPNGKWPISINCSNSEGVGELTRAVTISDPQPRKTN